MPLSRQVCWRTCPQDWAKQLDYEESLRKQQEAGKAGAAAASSAAAADPAAPSKGFLSLTSKVDLNSMDVDLSAQLRPRKKDGDAAAAAAAPPQRRRPPVKYGSVPPTRVEQRAWERGGKYSRKVVAIAPTNEEAQVGAALLCRREGAPAPQPPSRAALRAAAGQLALRAEVCMRLPSCFLIPRRLPAAAILPAVAEDGRETRRCCALAVLSSSSPKIVPLVRGRAESRGAAQ
jgi:hypothetical protein